MKQEKKILWADNLRAIATIGAILLHVSAPLLSQDQPISSLSWWVGNIYDSSVRFCVPVFVMLTGALLLSKDYELTDFLRKRFFRVVFPFVFWSLVYIIFNLSLRVLHGENISAPDILFYVFTQLRDGSSYHLWFVYMIIGLYLIIPIIGKWIRNSNDKEILYFLLVWLCVMILNQPGLLTVKPGIDLTYFTGFIGYLVLGHYLTIKSFSKSIYPILLILIGVLITIFGTYYSSLNNGSLDELFYNYLTPNVLMISTGIFLLFKHKQIRSKSLAKIRDFISRYSFGIYLVHILILSVLSKAGITGNLGNPIIGIPLTTLICLIMSAGVIYTLNKLPYGKFISG